MIKPLAASTLLVFTLVAGATEPLPVRQCKSYVQGRIDVLDADLHKGSKPNEAQKLLKRRDKLKAQFTDCERNPNAYKKDI